MATWRSPMHPARRRPCSAISRSAASGSRRAAGRERARLHDAHHKMLSGGTSEGRHLKLKLVRRIKGGHNIGLLKDQIKPKCERFWTLPKQFILDYEAPDEIPLPRACRQYSSLRPFPT